MNAQVNRNHAAQRCVTLALSLMLFNARHASAQTFELRGHAIAGGGATSTDNLPGGFEVSGTIGQDTARSPVPPLSGGTFELVGGLWPTAAATCTRPGDMNLDGDIDGDDAQFFVNCVFTGTGSCDCADLDGGGVGAGDIESFVTALLNG